MVCLLVAGFSLRIYLGVNWFRSCINTTKLSFVYRQHPCGGVELCSLVVFLGVQAGVVAQSGWRGAGVIKALKKTSGKLVMHILPLFLMETYQLRTCLLRNKKTLGGSMCLSVLMVEIQIRVQLCIELCLRRKKGTAYCRPFFLPARASLVQILIYFSDKLGMRSADFFQFD